MPGELEIAMTIRWAFSNYARGRRCVACGDTILSGGRQLEVSCNNGAFQPHAVFICDQCQRKLDGDKEEVEA